MRFEIAGNQRNAGSTMAVAMTLFDGTPKGLRATERARRSDATLSRASHERAAM